MLRGNIGNGTNVAEARDGRVRRPQPYLNDYVTRVELSELTEEEANMMELNMVELDNCDPSTFEEAEKSEEWKQAMDDEIRAIERNLTWKLTELPKGAKCIGIKWIYKTKLNERGKVDKLKARLVAKGYSQEHGIDFTEVFAPVARMDTVRMVIAKAAQNGWKIFQLDVKSAFLHGALQEDVYVEQQGLCDQRQ